MNDREAKLYRDGVRDGMEITLRLLNGEQQAGGWPFIGRKSKRLRRWILSSLARIEQDRWAARFAPQGAIRSWQPTIEEEQMEFGEVVAYNDGDQKQVAFVRSGTGDKTDLAVLTRNGVSFENDVPRRDPSDYGAEGGGRTWHPVGAK